MNIPGSERNMIAETIKNMFFMPQESIVSDELIGEFNKAGETGIYTPVAKHIHQHTDTFSVYFTHDIDWLNPLHPYSIINSVRSVFSDRYWLTFKQLASKEIFLRTIDNLITLERQNGIHGVYHVGAADGKSFHRYGIRYNQKTRLYSEMINLLKTGEQHIGLHSSFDAESNHLVEYEKKSLEDFIQKPVLAHRSHFLNYSEQSLYNQLEACGIIYDFGKGHAREAGLPSTIPGKYRPFNTLTGKVFNLTVVPMILMDNIFFVKPYHEVMEQFKKTLLHVKHYNGSVCILFHPENFILKPQLWSYFEEIIHICRSEGARINPGL